ncbi:hypothetical protein Trco_006935 [Trichoderma cornu-damae]|uniref:Uncharacterized protein n=1 Tax=Trichoderma cornu-damae TaxID=654480 RepID=A0A9P8TUD2_9HYPO|nr:hypothetical protein Trco_006935 [Trichoderma cornu-damae]
MAAVVEASIRRAWRALSPGTAASDPGSVGNPMLGTPRTKSLTRPSAAAWMCTGVEASSRYALARSSRLRITVETVSQDRGQGGQEAVSKHKHAHAINAPVG